MDKIEARRKIKTHVRERGKDNNLVVTPTLVLFWWHLLNKAVFGGILTPPKRIEIKKFHDCYGWCSGYKRHRRVAMGIRSNINDRKLFLTVLIHEMIHQWEHETYGIMTHGQTFFEWQGKVKRHLGLELSVKI